MTDIFDRATEREEQLRSAALEDQGRHDPSRGKTVLDSAYECRVCGDRIPEKRRRAVPGVQTCVPCQADLEKALP